jgi:hypothetical protein
MIHALEDIQQPEKDQYSCKDRDRMEAQGIPKRHVGCEVKDVLNQSDDRAGEYPRYGESHTGMIFPLAALSTSSEHAVLRRGNLEPQN